MKQICLWVCLLASLFARNAHATDYYVDCLEGSNGDTVAAIEQWKKQVGLPS